MRYTVKCNECGRDFVAEAENYGTMKYRCPYCGNVLTCRFDPPKPSRTRARSVVPLVDVTPVQAKKMKDMPVAKTHVISMPTKEKLAEMRAKLNGASQHVLQASLHAGVTLKNATVTTSSWLRRFQEKYADGDLWIFFGFSLLFILSVFIGLFICAEVVKLVAEGHSWLLKNYIEIKNSL